MADDADVMRAAIATLIVGVGETCPVSLSPQQTTVASVRTAHAWSVPALTWVKVPAGAVRPLPPQQATVVSVRSAHEWVSPVLTWVKVPAGANDVCPLKSSPQQTTVLSVRSAHDWCRPR